jgi:hypothetical protein
LELPPVLDKCGPAGGWGEGCEWTKTGFCWSQLQPEPGVLTLHLLCPLCAPACRQPGGPITVETTSGKQLPADMLTAHLCPLSALFFCVSLHILIRQPGGQITVETASGKQLPADLVMLVIGVRPEAGLAKAAGLELGPRGGIKVDGHMRTSDPDIYAVGECVGRVPVC